jgi:hypothetical protein
MFSTLGSSKDSGQSKQMKLLFVIPPYFRGGSQNSAESAAPKILIPTYLENPRRRKDLCPFKKGYGNHWSRISVHAPTRADNMIKNRWYSILAKKAKEDVVRSAEERRNSSESALSRLEKFQLSVRFKLLNLIDNQ